MFEIFIPEKGARRKNARKALTFSLSLLLHALLITAVIVMPLLRAEANLPEFRITDAALIAPPVMPGVPPGPGRGPKPKSEPVEPSKGPKNPPPASRPRGFLAPVEIPAEITDENPADFVPDDPVGPGVEGGSGDGKSPWKMGEPVAADSIDATAPPVVMVRPPRLLKRVSPDYPQVPLIARISGVVVIEASTDVFGLVKEAHVISGNSLFHEAALEAVRQWKYEPYYVNGIPRPVRFTVTITFNLTTR